MVLCYCYGVVLLATIPASTRTDAIRSTVGANVMGMRTVQLCNIKLPRINQKPMDSRTIINLLSSAMCETKRTHTHTHVRARVKRKEE